jgi:carbamoyltransferase
MHDAALAIVNAEGRPVFAEAAERHLQCKRAYNCPPDDLIRIPALIREHCPADAELVVATGWSGEQLERLETFARSASERHEDADVEAAWPFPTPYALGLALRNSLSQAGLNLRSTPQIPNPTVLRRYDHHLTHAASAVHTGPFDECAVAVVDGFGERGSTSFFNYRAGRLEPVRAAHDEESTASLGFFYARLCALCGFDPIRGEEWKVMGLAAHGSVDDELYALLRPFIAVRGLALVSGCTPEHERTLLRRLRGRVRRPDESPLLSADLARTGQLVFEDVMTELLQELHARVPSSNLALAGGCGLNSSYNGKVLERTPFERLHVPSAPADDGTALGAALQAYYDDHPAAARTPAIETPFLGTGISPVALRRVAEFGGSLRIRHVPGAVHELAADLLAAGRIIGWMQGRAEFGPRALGNRSVLADPRPPWMKDRINERVKFREEFRPFAPSILDERGPEYFESYQTTPYMERTLRFRPEVRCVVPAVVHEDGTGRVQSVRREWNDDFHRLIAAFERRTGVPLVLNTSLNVMGRPIVHAVEDALGMFFTSGLEALVIDDYLIEK